MQHPEVQVFQRTVWKVVRQVPLGIVTTYGQIASMIPCPQDMEPQGYQRLAPRWVGDAMNKVSRADAKNIPWWRVINAKGGISLPEGSKAAQQQLLRLKREGVIFDDQDRVSFEVVGWEGPPADWLAQHGLLTPISLKPPPPSEDNPRQLRLL